MEEQRPAHVFTNHDISVVQLVRSQDTTNSTLINLGQRYSRVDGDATGSLWSEDDVWSGLVETDANCLELDLQQTTLCLSPVEEVVLAVDVRCGDEDLTWSRRA